MYIFSLPWGWVSKLLSRSAGVGHVFLSNPFLKSSSPPPHPLYFLTTPYSLYVYLSVLAFQRFRQKTIFSIITQKKKHEQQCLVWLIKKFLSRFDNSDYYKLNNLIFENLLNPSLSLKENALKWPIKIHNRDF